DVKEQAAPTAEGRAIRALFQNLTRREKEVLNHLVAGRINKQTAFILGIREKTIKLHRGRVMKKLGVRHVAQLVRMTDRLSLQPSSIEVRFWHLADIPLTPPNVRFRGYSGHDEAQISALAVAIGGKADMSLCTANVRLWPKDISV